MTWWQAFPTTRQELLIGIVMLYLLVYRPPTSAAGLRDLIERHFGDSIGFYILHLGIFLVFVGAFYEKAASLVPIGQSLFFGGAMALKLKTVPGPANGNGNGAPVSTVTTHTDTTSDVKTVAPAAGTVVIPQQVVPAQVIKPAQPKVGP